jgi:sarcosine oxidase
MRVGVIGAGVIGLATAYELARFDDVDVRCYDSGEPMAGRSLGDTRIFRTGHADPRLVRLALDAHTGWRRWESELGVALLGRETVVLSGPAARTWAAAMRDTGASFELRDEVDGLGLPSRRPPGPFLLDPLGGVLAARATGRSLAAALPEAVRAGDRVTALDVLGSGSARIRSEHGGWDCDSVLILAGSGTPELAASVGLGGVPAELRHHHRFTFRLARPEQRPSCWLEQSGTWRRDFTTYQHQVGPGLWAIGGSLGEQDTAWQLGTTETAERARRVLTAYVQELLDDVLPQIVDTVHCDSMGTGDGVRVGQAGPVLALWGDNLFKFAPRLGALLARSGRQRQLAPELLDLA